MLRGPKNWTELLVAVLLIPVGLVAVSFGLYRARLAPTWTTGKLGVGGPLFAVSLPTGYAVVFAGRTSGHGHRDGSDRLEGARRD